MFTNDSNAFIPLLIIGVRDKTVDSSKYAARVATKIAAHNYRTVVPTERHKEMHPYIPTVIITGAPYKYLHICYI